MKINKSKGFTLIELLVVIVIISILTMIVLSFSHAKKAEACGFWDDCPTATNDIAQAKAVQRTLISSTPIPQLDTSLERANVAKRAVLFSKSDKISYIYLVSYGKVMAFYTVKGKVSSLRSYMAPMQKIVRPNGNDNCSDISDNCMVVDAPDIDGTYGENVEGVFFFTTEGAYVEWKGDYMMSDQPLRLATQPELIREIK